MLYLGHFGRFSSNFVFEFILGRSGLGLYIGEFRQISLLFMLKFGFGALSVGILRLILFKLSIWVNIWEEWFGMIDLISRFMLKIDFGALS